MVASLVAVAQTYTGKVGINTTAPEKTLHVNGNFQTIAAPVDGVENGIITNYPINGNPSKYILSYASNGSLKALIDEGTAP